MTGGLGLEYAALRGGDRDWSRLAELMDRTRDELADAPVAALAPGVQGAARGFLAAWSGYAGDSAEIAYRMGDALSLLADDVTSTEEERREAFARLDGRLGPRR